MNVNISLPQLAACEIYSDPARKTYQGTFTDPASCVDIYSDGDEEMDEYDSELVTYQSKVASILFDISIHENSVKNLHIMNPPLTPEYVATLNELKQAEQKFGLYCWRWQLSISSYFKNSIWKAEIPSTSTYSPSRLCGMECLFVQESFY